MNKTLMAYIYLALAMAIAGSAVVAGKLMVATLPVFLAAELGLAVGLVFLLPLTFLLRRESLQLDLKTNLSLLAQAVCGIVLYRVFTFWGLQYTSAAAGGLISSAAPVIIALLAFFLLRETLNGRRIAGTICVVAGLLAVNLSPFLTATEGMPEASGVHALQALKGNALVFVAVLCEAAFAVMTRKACGQGKAVENNRQTKQGNRGNQVQDKEACGQGADSKLNRLNGQNEAAGQAKSEATEQAGGHKPMSALYRTTLVTLYAFLCLLPFAVRDAMHHNVMSSDLTTVLCIVYYGFFVSFLSYVFWFKGISVIPAGIAASFTGLVPLTGIILSWLILREPLNVLHIAGLGGVLVGILLSCLPEKGWEFRSYLRSPFTRPK